MDSTYLDASNCNDWTTGSFPRNIPSTNSSKATHYPSSGNGVATSCGSSGNLTLGNGQYNLNDHAHIRANVCPSGCTPTFNNPSAAVKYVFVEGSLRFDQLTTTAGSGPIIFIVYGPDPSSLTDVCPYGGSFYLGGTGETIAPKVYFVATNGICLDKTKFGASPALAGFTAKNIYIATNSGSPHDLSLDVNFPLDSIPVNLSWKSVYYRRVN